MIAAQFWSIGLRIITATLLLIGVGSLPYSYYEFLRIIVFAGHSALGLQRHF